MTFWLVVQVLQNCPAFQLQARQIWLVSVVRCPFECDLCNLTLQRVIYNFILTICFINLPIPTSFSFSAQQKVTFLMQFMQWFVYTETPCFGTQAFSSWWPSSPWNWKRSFLKWNDTPHEVFLSLLSKKLNYQHVLRSLRLLKLSVKRWKIEQKNVSIKKNEEKIMILRVQYIDYQPSNLHLSHLH